MKILVKEWRAKNKKERIKELEEVAELNKQRWERG